MTLNSWARRVAVGAVALTTLLAGCSADPTNTGGGSTESAADDPNAPITIWTDATRKDGFEAYKKAHPEMNISVTVVDGGQLLNKIQLANRAGKGWPDIVWGDVVVYQMASEEYGKFAQPLNDLIPADKLKGFGKNNEYCTYDGKVYCLRNDVAPSVLYYNVETFKKHNYAVPKTMEEYFTLAEKMGKDDPKLRAQIEGYNGMALLQYYQASGCPFAKLEGVKEMTINWNDPKCTRVTEGLDRMVKAGVLKFDQLNEKQTAAQGSSGAMAMTLGAVWRADYVFGPAYKWKNGNLGVAKVPSWGSEAYAGYEGGGGYVMGSHARNKKGVIDVLLYMAAGEFQKTAGTLPAYEPARQEWMKTHVLTNKLYAEPEQVMKTFNESVGMLDPNDKLTSFNPRDSWEATVTPQGRKGKTIAESIPELQKHSVQAAKAAGFTVKEG